MTGAVAEHRFCAGRKWRFDFAFVGRMVAVEIQGAIFGTGPRCRVCKQRKAGRHTRGPALREEYEKLREAAALGWLVLLVPSDEVIKRHFIGQLKRALS